MDTRAIADALGTDPKTLRRFLRDPATSFTPVGSGSRYTFTDEDLKVIRHEFEPWSNGQAAKTATKPLKKSVATSARARRKAMTQDDRDQLVWEEEEKAQGSPVVLADLRNPRERARVRALAQAAEDRLTARLLSCGLHITQMRDRAAA